VVKQWVDWFVTPGDLMGERFKQGEIDSLDRACTPGTVWGLVSGERGSAQAWLRAGRLVERIFLQATVEGYAICPVSYPTELPASTEAVAALMGLAPGHEPLFLFRMGRARRLPRSVRRDIASVVVS
jgi:hypothetical protein